jgi:demethylmenaquinone methyltransferase/2-methoxy-6-polyprenyl-1,4-benzoquinol methylase
VAIQKRWPKGRVQFGVLDAFRLDAVRSLDGRSRPVASHGPFDAVFAGFWWSHVPLGGLTAFLENVRRSVPPESPVAFVDNRYVEGSSTPVARSDAEGNTYQLRRLEDGSTHEVLKNFPDEAGITRAAVALGDVVELRLLKYFWCLRCSTQRR